jgi:hypothetical protein
VELTGLLSALAESFDRHRLRFMLIGEMAVSYWVEPRLTRDIDIVVAATKRNHRELKEALIGAGARPTAIEMRILFEKTWVRMPTTGPRLDIHLSVGAHDRDAFGHAGRFEVGGHALLVASPEDLVLYKLKAWRPVDQADIGALLRGVKNVNAAYIDSWLDRIARATAQPMRERWEDSLRQRHA